MLGRLKAVAIAIAGLCAFASMSATAESLTAGQSLSAGQGLPSHDGRYTAIMQGDGNFVVYRNADGAAIWNTQTSGSGAAFAIMQSDGNFVLYKPNGTPVWWTGTTWQAGSQPNQFTVDDQGLAVVVSYVPVWTSNTSNPNLPQGAPLVFQAGYMFQQGVIYNGPNGITWTFQSDGNLVMYRSGTVVWSSGVVSNHSGKAVYAVWNGILSTWNDAGSVWNGADTRTYPAGFVFNGEQVPLHLGIDGALLSIQGDANMVVWSAARKWGASTYDPTPPPTPPSGPHCVGDPHACAGSGGTIPVIDYPW